MKRKNLSKEERRGEEAFEINQKLIGNENLIRKLNADNAKLYNEIYERQLYKDLLGDEEAEWAGFLSQVEVYRSRLEIYQLTKCYKKYERELGLDLVDISDIPLSRLIRLLPFADNANVHDLLGEARTLLPSDWNIKIRNLKGLPTEEDCKHEFVEYEICKTCGEKHRVGEKKHNEEQPIKAEADKEV